MATKTKTPREKMENGKQPVVQTLTPSQAARLKASTMLVPTPNQIEAEIKKIPRGSIRTMADLRAELARAAGADITCALCAGIFWRLTAEAAEFDRANGDEPAPYWRVVREKGDLNDKLPGGIEGHRALLAAEGHQFAGKRVKISS